MGHQDPQDEDLRAETGYIRAMELMRRCQTEYGFWASPTPRDNYRRIWSRDGCIIGLAALMSKDDGLILTCRKTLETLAACQGPHGEIPSNVDPRTDRISYGGTAGRVDADLWFVLACGEYWRRTGDDVFLEKMIDPLEKVRRLLGSWEFNNRGLLYIPPTGDWADEYLQSGYVLYDQLLYLAAQRWFCLFHRHLHQGDDHQLLEKTARLENLIRTNYWFRNDDEDSPHVYHRVLYAQGRKAAPHRSGPYWMPFFTPFGFGYRFDTFANTLVSLFGLADAEQEEAVDHFVDSELVSGQAQVLPAFWPVITPRDEKWSDLQTTFTYEFKNKPYEFHNGGRWPMVTGFYAASLARRGRRARAREFLEALHRANSLEKNGRSWSFPEYLHGRTLAPEGAFPLGWSAAGAVIATAYLSGDTLFTTCSS